MKNTLDKIPPSYSLPLLKGGMGRDFSILILLVSFVLFPLFSYAAPIVPCGIDGNTQTYTAGGKTHTYAEPCTFEHFLIGINNVINFLIMITGSVAAIIFAVAGVLILTAGTNEGQVTKAKETFGSVLKGFVWILAAWLLVKMVLVGLGVPAEFSLLEN